MFSIFLEKLSGFFDKHWLLRYFFPSLAFWAAGLAVYGAARGITEPIDLWHRQPAEVQVILLAGSLLWLTLFAYLLANFATALIRLFEGYWEHPPLSWLRKRRHEYYKNRFLFLQAEVKQPEGTHAPHERQRLEREWLLLFPRGRGREKAVMPTRLGNIIKAAETYPRQRYGADAAILWPRLAPFLPAEFAEALSVAQTSMEIMLVLSALSFVFSVVSCSLLAALTLDIGLFAVCAVGFLLAWICYRNSLHGALGYAELIKTAFDLHRGKLLDALGLEKPSDPEEERKIWDDVSQWFFRNTSFLTARLKATPAPKQEPPPKTWVGTALEELFAAIQAPSPKPGPPAAPAPPLAVPAKQPPPPLRLKEPRDRFPYLYFGGLALLCLALFSAMALRAWHPVRQVALARDVSVYRLLSGANLRMEKPPRFKVPEGGIGEIYGPEIFGPSWKAYSIQPLAKGTLLKKSEIRTVESTDLLDGKVAMGISVTTVMVLGGALRSGDVVALAILPAKDAPPPDPSCDLKSLRRLLAMDVKAPEKEGAPYVVVLAVPPDCQATLAGAVGRISLAREI